MNHVPAGLAPMVRIFQPARQHFRESPDRRESQRLTGSSHGSGLSTSFNDTPMFSSTIALMTCSILRRKNKSRDCPAYSAVARPNPQGRRSRQAFENCGSRRFRPGGCLVQHLWLDSEFGPHAGSIVTWHVADKQVFSSLQFDRQCA